MDKKELAKANGDVYFEATRMPDNSYILVNWIGIQSLETVMMGANQLLAMLRKRPCAAILNSNKELIGPWEDGALFLGSNWAAKASVLGVKHFAHVLAHGIYGRRAFTKFQQSGQKYLQVATFHSDEEAAAWLRT